MSSDFLWRSHIGVYALITQNNKLLVIKKAKGPYTGLFDLPGGSLEDGELLEETLVREIKEETTCDVTSYQQIPTISFVYPYKDDDQHHKLRHIAVLYKVEIEGIPTEEPDGCDSNGCVWLELGMINAENASPLILEALKV